MLLRSRLSLPARRFLCSTTVSIDVSKLRRAAAAHSHDDKPATGLLRELQSRIRFQGPMTVAEYMTAALTHPVHGYYMRRDVFGREGDFITSPEISQVFGDLLGVWCVSCWEQLGKPARVRLVEAGPGRGTLMADVLRATAIFPAFHKALSVHLLEVSPFMRGMQRRTLGRTEEADAAEPAAEPPADEEPLVWTPPHLPQAGGVRVEWLAQLEDLPQDAPPCGKWKTRPFLASAATPPHQPGRRLRGGRARPCAPESAAATAWKLEDAPLLLLGHEFLDALPVHQLSRTGAGWRERMVELREHVAGAAGAAGSDGAPGAAGAPAAASAADAAGAPPPEGAEGERAEGRRLEFVLSRSRTPAASLYGEQLASTHGADLLEAEVCPAAQRFAALVARQLAVAGGAALFIDYGQDGPPAFSLRGIVDHEFVDPLARPGEADLSVDVDFDAAAPKMRIFRFEPPGLRVPPLVSQRDFLAAMGLEPRVNALLRERETATERRELIRSAQRLVESPGMGTAYKALALAHPRPAGHAVGSSPMDHIAGFPATES